MSHRLHLLSDKCVACTELQLSESSRLINKAKLQQINDLLITVLLLIAEQRASLDEDFRLLNQRCGLQVLEHNFAEAI